jgi:hypothetical protein
VAVASAKLNNYRDSKLKTGKSTVRHTIRKSRLRHALLRTFHGFYIRFGGSKLLPSSYPPVCPTGPIIASNYKSADGHMTAGFEAVCTIKANLQTLIDTAREIIPLKGQRYKSLDVRL